ncbi:MAG: SRPBCC family protein [Planctomycetota bacterium]
MYHANQASLALLPPEAYTTRQAFESDRVRLRDDSWQLVAVRSQLSKHGDYVAIEQLGVPLLVRNDGDELVGLLNVCAHRHCQIAENGEGWTQELRCPYHGWRYGKDGRTRKLPGAKNFPNLDRDTHRLQLFPVQTLGSLVFAYLGDGQPPQLSTGPGADWWNELGDRTSQDAWRLVLADQLDYDCDWKIPIEGSLESYHLDEVHAETFGQDPGEGETEHQLEVFGTRFTTHVRGKSWVARWEERLIRWMIGSFDPAYHHVHLYPGVMASLTETMTLVYQIFPAEWSDQRGGSTSRMRVFGFTRRDQQHGWLGKLVERGIGHAAAKLARKVLAEDCQIFPKVQAGMQAARSPRVFGRCEERLTDFHRYWQIEGQGAIAGGGEY